jgi:hypothetical protein
MSRTSLLNLRWLNFDALYIRFVALLARNVAKQCIPSIVGRTLAPCCFGRDTYERSNDVSRSRARVADRQGMISTSVLMFVGPDTHVVNPNAGKL